MREIDVSQERLNTWLIAFILCVNTFSKILGIFIYIPFNIVLMETVAFVSLALINDRQIWIKRELVVILVIVASIMGYSLILWQFDRRVIERLLKFVMYALFVMLCIQYPFKERTLLKAIYIIGFIHMVYLFTYAVPLIDAGIMSIDNTMDLSYTSLIYLFAGAGIVGDKREKLITRIIALALCLVYAYFLTAVSANRGALIAAICYLALRFVISSKSRRLRIFLFLCVVTVSFIIFLNLLPILESLDDFASAHGIVINPLQKTIWQLNNSDMISGRGENYAAALRLIEDTSALPNGVASYQILTDAAYYPHNIFLEAVVEFGFFGLILVSMIILKAFYCIVISPTKYCQLILVFFCLSIPRLMVSSSYWENSYIWPMTILMWSSDLTIYSPHLSQVHVQKVIRREERER
jgi:O-antigen ligase